MTESVKLFANSLTIIKLVGKGSFGDVYLVQDRNHQQFALKKFTQCENSYFDELDKLKNMPKDAHEFILKFESHFEEDLNRCILTEYCEDGDLGKMIEFYEEEKLYLTEDQILEFSFQISKGLEYLHGINIIHRDVKPDNLFLKNNRVKIGDLGISIEVRKVDSNIGGTPAYLSPELAMAILKHTIDPDIISQAADMWAFGCVIYELITLKKAYWGRNLKELFKMIADEKPPEVETSYLLGSILNRLLRKEKDKRPTSLMFSKALETIKTEKKNKERNIVLDAFEEIDKLTIRENTYFKNNRYKFVKKLGSKLFGTVFLVEDTHELYKNKAIKLINATLKTSEVKTVLKEIEYIRKANSPYILAYLEEFKLLDQYCIVCEYCLNGDLAQMIKRYKRTNQLIPEKKVFRIALQFLRALNNLHSIVIDENDKTRKIIHRNIKPGNIFFDLNKIKIGDLCMVTSSASISNAYSSVGTPYYLSPEIAKNQPYSQKTDVWSAGVVLYEIITLERPFTGTSSFMIVESIIEGKVNYDSISQKSEEINKLKELIKSMLVEEKSRPESNSIFKSIEKFDQHLTKKRREEKSKDIRI